MSNYANTKATIAANVYENHLNQVTANMAKAAINSVVDALIAGGYLYAGVAHIADAASTPDANVFKIATEVGTYTNYKNSSNVSLVVNDGEVAVFKYNGSWSKEVTGAATAAQVTELGQEVDGKVPIKYGKNLLYPGFVTLGKFVATNGILSDNANYNLSGFIPVVAGETYYASDNVDVYLGSAAAVFGWYDEYFHFIGSTSGQNKVITAPATAKYLRASIGIAKYARDPQIALGSSKTPFEPSSPIAGYPILEIPDGIVSTSKIVDSSVTEKKIGNDVRGFVFVGGAELSPVRVLSSYKLSMTDDQHPIVVNSTTDVIFFSVGANKRFRVRGKSSIVAPACGLFDKSVSPFAPQLKIADWDGGGNYEIYGETTSTLQIVGITVDKDTDYSCVIVEPVSQYVAALNGRLRIDIKTTDSEIDILNKMLDAYNIGNCDVYFEKGEYVFSEVYIYMRDTLHWSWTMELPIGNNCRYFFNNSTLISNTPVEEFADGDGRCVLGCKAGVSDKINFELYDGILINNGGTYCVHDEALSAIKPYVHKYHNMRMILNPSADMGYISKCIGGGAGRCGLVIIDNCVFEQNNPTLTTEDVSWHGLADENTPSDMSFFVTQCYFSRKFRVASAFKSMDSLFVKYSGNSAADAPRIASEPSTLETILFNNETR